ncbi:MAG: ribosome assembly cofactor RimP [Saprospiraceae bacterium]|nr:ribosome assembly cofactor RimP [Saprospiraceae bacterium]
MIEEQIKEWLLVKFEEPEYSDCFLIELSISPSKLVDIIIDADNGVTFEQCQRISRHIENLLDTEGVLGDEYTLEVGSPGLSRSLKLARQYPRNIGRTLEVTDTEGVKTTGILTASDDEKIVIEFEDVRKEGKKKIKETVKREFPFEKIKSAFVQISFK